METPVGYRCSECAGGPRISTYRPASTAVFAKATGAGLLVGVAVGIAWGFWPAWGFYFSLLLGFGVAEVMARLANDKRGNDLMAAAMGIIVVGLLVSRYTIAATTDFLTIDLLINNFSNEAVRRAFYLRPLPDMLFMGIPFVIAYIRFNVRR